MKKLVFGLLCVSALFVTKSFSQSYPVGGRIAFVSERSGRPEVWLLDLETNVPFQLTHSDQQPYLLEKFYPKWSPDGKRITFGSRETINDSTWRVFIINDDGTGLRQVTNYWSHISKWDPINPDILYCIKFDGAGKVMRINVKTLEETEIPNAPPGHTQWFVVSPNGQELLFSREPGCCWGPDMFTGYQDMQGLASRIILPTDGTVEAVWNINKQDDWILFNQGSPLYVPNQVFKMDKDGKNITQLTFGGYLSENAVWTTGDNNGYVIFSSTSTGNPEVLLMRADGLSFPNGVVNLTQHENADYWPDWTPYGSKRYTFEGFINPIENLPVVNKANAGQTIPVKWRITDRNGLPVSDEASFLGLASYRIDCETLAGDPTNIIWESITEESGLRYLGDGWWHYNWKTPKSYKGQCRTMKLTLDDKSEHTASFSFK